MSALRALAPMTAAELVAALGQPARIVGDPARRIESLAPLEAVGPGALAFAKLRPADLRASGAVVIVPAPADDALSSSAADGVTLIHVADPRTYFIRAARRLVGPERHPLPGRAGSAVVAADADVGDEVHLGPAVVVGAGAVIGRGSVLYAGARIHDGVEIGEGTVVQANAVVGSQGQAYERDSDGAILELPHLGRVIIGARSRIGANTTIVRGTLRDTVIGADTSIGNNVNIGHNVVVGARCFVGAGVVLAGSSSVGDDSWVSPGVVVRGVAVGRSVTLGAGAIVTRPIPDGKTANGFPARVTAGD